MDKYDIIRIEGQVGHLQRVLDTAESSRIEAGVDNKDAWQAGWYRLAIVTAIQGLRHAIDKGKEAAQ